MQGSGRFYDPRLNDATTFPVAARLGFANVQGTPDPITGKLPALQFYQLALTAPKPPLNSFDPTAADRGKLCLPARPTAPRATSLRCLPNRAGMLTRRTKSA